MVADLFEPRMRWEEDTEERPFASVRAAVEEQLLAPHRVRLASPPPAKGGCGGGKREAGRRAGRCADERLQTDDDLCQTWVAAYVAERAKGEGHAEAVRRLQPSSPNCDRLCALLRFSERVYEAVPFPAPRRRGNGEESTLAERKATTTRPFAGSPGACR